MKGSSDTPQYFFIKKTMIIISFLSMFLLHTNSYSMKINLPEGVTPISHEVYHLHMLMFYICCVIAFVVFGVMFYSLINHRKAAGHKAKMFHENTTVEIIWTIIPMIVLIAMAIPASYVYIRMNDTKDSDLTIKVTGYQWKWKYDYLDNDISFFSSLSTPQDEIMNHVPKSKNYLREVDKPLVLPIGKKIRFLFTANDVIHSWWVEDLGFKKDAIPGFINENWAQIDRPGIYRGQCAELCGVGHGYMPIVIDAKTPEDYEQWLKKQEEAIKKERELAAKKFTLEESMVQGEKIYKKICVVCHQPNGKGMGAFPALAGAAITTSKDWSKQLQTVLYGRNGTAMQAFKAQLSEVELANVITYTRNAWGNNTKQVVQPLDIKKYIDNHK